MELYSITNKYKEDFILLKSLEPLRKKVLVSIGFSGIAIWIIMISFIIQKINITLITISLLMIFFTMLGMIAIDVKEEKILNKINCTTYSRHNIYQYDEYFIINKWYICKTENYLLFLDDELQPIPLTKEQYELIFEKTKNQLKPLYIEGNIIDIYRENKIDTRIVVIEL